MCVLQLVWLGINAFLFVHFYMAFLVDRWFYTRVLLGVSLTCSITPAAQIFTRHANLLILMKNQIKTQT